MYRRLMVPLDGSALGKQALTHAVAQAERFGAEIVLSTRGHSGWNRWLLGNVAGRVARGATVQVLLVQCQKAREE